MAIEKIVVVDDELMIQSIGNAVANKRYSVASAGDLNPPVKFCKGFF